MRDFEMIKNKKFLLGGQFALLIGFIGFLINCFLLEHISIIAFLSGMFLGISLVLNLTFLYRTGKMH
jgi:hypothetical protein